MKPSPFSLLTKTAATMAAVLALGASLAQAQLPAGSTMGIANGTVANSSRVTMTDPGNHIYVLQSSSNLTSWTDVETWKVHNGSFRRQLGFNPSTTSRLFYRAFYDPARADIQSTTANALLLPPVPANYANPALPPSFLVQPIAQRQHRVQLKPARRRLQTPKRVLLPPSRLQRPCA